MYTGGRDGHVGCLAWCVMITYGVSHAKVSHKASNLLNGRINVCDFWMDAISFPLGYGRQCSKRKSKRKTPLDVIGPIETHGLHHIASETT